MAGKRCFFIGHREVSDNLLPTLRAAIEQHITEYGVISAVRIERENDTLILA